MYTTVQLWAQAGLRGACSARSKSRELAFFHGIAFHDAKPLRTMENPQFSYSLCWCYHAVPPALKLSTLRQPRYKGSRTSSSFLCDGHDRCFSLHVCAMIPVALGSRNENIISRAVQLMLG